jgi:quinate dehydrogenase
MGLATASLGLDKTPRELYLIGIGTGHSVAPPMHNYIAKSLHLPWTFHTKECSTIEDCMKLLQSDICAGASITMPYKGMILGQLNEVDELARTLAACNTVCKYRSGSDRKLIGTNVDWCGISGSLLEGSVPPRLPSSKVALVIGAGGAARAAIYALSAQIGCHEIWILNRDEQEVLDLMRDVDKHYDSQPRIIHVKSIQQARALRTPVYIVGTVPDFEPVTAEEKMLKNLLRIFLDRPEKGVMLDMCYKPRRTRHLILGEVYKWRTIEGTRVIGHQAELQWRAWVGDDGLQILDKQGMWECLQRTADESTIVNPRRE